MPKRWLKTTLGENDAPKGAPSPAFGLTQLDEEDVGLLRHEDPSPPNSAASGCFDCCFCGAAFAGMSSALPRALAEGS